MPLSNPAHGPRGRALGRALPAQGRLRAVLPLALALLVAACGRGGKAPAMAAEDAQASLTVTTVQPESRSVAREIVASGSVAAWQEMSLGVELAGVRVSQVLVEVGARVKAGQPLLVLDRRTLDVQARQADANVAQARANLQVAEAAKVRGESLLANRLISTSNFEELTAALSRALAQLTVAEADREAARLRLSFATLRAPDDGVISSRTVQPGQIAATGTELLRLIRQGRLEWRAEVSYLDLPRIVPGAEVALSVPGAEPVVGRIRAISPAVDPTRRTALVYADLPEPGALRAGMFAEGRLRVGQARTLAVPRESVVYRDGLPYVFLVSEDARVRQQRVEIGAAQGDFVELRAGVDASQRVVGRGAGFLSDGDRVRIVAAAAAAAPTSGPAPATRPGTGS
jgi:RND family efflux transporter MFP subunit